ncbi:MAG: T9SS type A sorting domain-containing protein [Bacteroidia bacterium]|nr:T9SS type A sorting domain-containing protein [Bacteroidia bacterium]
MKKLILFALSLLSIQPILGQNQLLKNLERVNAQWKNQVVHASLLQAVHESDQKSFDDWIATHLSLVEQELRLRKSGEWNEEQWKNRSMLLDHLNQYWHSRAFPVNDYLPYKNPVFIDRNGNHCAVGYLMQQSGYEALAQQIDREQKFAYLHDIRTPGVAEWAQKHGFTADELAWIQPGYPPTFFLSSMAGGLNASVNALAVDPVTGILYAGGDFTLNNDGISCQHVAAYMSGFAGWFWMDLGSNCNGKVNTMLIHNNRLYIGGEFTSVNGQSANHMAVYDLGSGQWSSMGSLDGTVNTIGLYNNELYAGGRFTGMLAKWDGNAWQEVNQGFLYGNEVRALEAVDSLLYIGGDFELATGALRRNVVSYWNNQFQISGMGTPTPVNDFERYNGKLYAACDYLSNTDTCALAVLENFDWQVQLPINPNQGGMVYFEGNIRKMLATTNGLLCAGDFQCSSLMTFGNNLMNYKTGPGLLEISPLVVVDSTISTLALLGENRLVMGGDFVNSYSQELNHLAGMDILTGLPPTVATWQGIKAYPNPTTDVLTLETSDYASSYEILGIDGKIWLKGSIEHPTQQLSLKSLPSGNYMMKLVTKQGIQVLKIIKL